MRPKTTREEWTELVRDYNQDNNRIYREKLKWLSPEELHNGQVTRKVTDHRRRTSTNKVNPKETK